MIITCHLYKFIQKTISQTTKVKWQLYIGIIGKILVANHCKSFVHQCVYLIWQIIIFTYWFQPMICHMTYQCVEPIANILPIVKIGKGFVENIMLHW